MTADKDGTLVVLEHRGWENLTGTRRESRAGYECGWPGVVELYRRTAEG